MILTHQITPCLWFDDRIEEAVKFYISVFGGELHETTYYGDAVPQQKGKVLTMTFTLQDQLFVALNGGPHFKFTEAVSFYVRCETQAEVDNYWNTLTADGGAGIAVRLAQGQVRPLLADRADAAPAHDQRQGPREGAARHAGDDEDEEDRHRGDRKSVRAANGSGS